MYPNLPALCPRCNKNLALVGIRHNCVVNTPVIAVNTPLKGSVADTGGDTPMKVGKARGVYPNTEHRRAYMREYMKRKRNSPPSSK